MLETEIAVTDNTADDNDWVTIERGLLTGYVVKFSGRLELSLETIRCVYRWTFRINFFPTIYRYKGHYTVVLNGEVHTLPKVQDFVHACKEQCRPGN
jgi:hypothetical protein